MSGAEPYAHLAGRLVAGGHVLPVRVYYEDTDFSGFVYHASYLRFMERGRSDFLRLLGVEQGALFAEAVAEAGGGLAFVVRSMQIDFLKPARIDDVLEIKTRVKEIGAATLTLKQVVHRDHIPLFEAEVMVVLVSRSGKPQRLGRMIRDALGRT
jgi:acyl-CoA thioester hydrolase